MSQDSQGKRTERAVAIRDAGLADRRVPHDWASLPEVPHLNELVGKLLTGGDLPGVSGSLPLQRTIRVFWISDELGETLPPTVLSSHAGHVFRLEVVQGVPAESSLEILADTSSVFDAAAVDISLPEWRGLNLFSMIRSKFPDLPVVIVCTAADENLALETMQIGAADYILREDLNGRTASRVIRSAVECRRLAAELTRVKQHLAANESVSRKMVNQLREEIARREEMEKHKDDFINTASHEIRSPLAVIKGAVENLRDGIAGKMSDQQVHYLDMAYRHMERLSKIINNLLDISRLEAGKAKMYREQIDASILIRDMAREFQIEASSQNIQIDCDIPENVPSVYADVDMLTQVITNLLSNALKFARTKIVISLQEVDSQTVRGVAQETLLPELVGVRITVADDGGGLDADQMSGLFNKYKQFHRAKDTRGNKGTGLGLAICKEIVEQHDGKIWAESKSGKGTKFHFVMPKFDADVVMETALGRNLSAAAQESAPLALMVLTLVNYDDLKTTLPPGRFDSMYEQIHKELVSTLFRKGDSVHPCLRRSAFAIIVQTGREGASAVRRRVQAKLAETFRRPDDTCANPHPVPTFKLGIAIYPEDASDPKPLFSRAFEHAVKI